MRASNPQRLHTSHSVSPFIRRSLLLLLTISILTAPLAAQTDQDTKRATAERLVNEVGQLRNEGSEESLQRAIQKLAAAQPLFHALNDSSGEALTLLARGFLYDALGEKQKALDYYNQALPVFRAIGDRGGEAMTLVNIAYSEREIGKLDDALAHIEASIAILESLRTKIGSQELRSSFFATVQGYYEFYIDLLMRLHKQQPTAGYDGKALQASERARARGLLELLTEAGADIRQGVDPKLVERERSLQQQLNARAQQQIQLLSGPHTQAQAAASAKEIERLTTEFQQVETQIRQTSPRYAALTQPQPLTLAEIQTQVLDADTLLLEYALGTDHSYLWTVTPTAITSYELPKRAEIEIAAREFYESVHTSPQEAANGAAAKDDLGGERQ